MKKLVKTAKQQFEFDLNALKVVKTWKMCESEIYHHCENKAGHFILLREQGGEYSILLYNRKYIEVVLSEGFLFSVTERFINGKTEITQLYNWYSSADHEDEPFNLLDIYMSDCEAVRHAYEDEYEEVPDPKIVTAREQWENDTKGLVAVRSCGEVTLFVNITESAVTFYDNYDGYACYFYPSLEEMRKDALFISHVTGEIMRGAHHNDIGTFMEWIREGGDVFPLNPAVIYDSEYQGYTFKMYADKEAQTIEKKDFSSEIEGLRERMVAHIQDLYKIGFSLNAEEFMENTATIAWIRGGCYDTANLRTCYLRDDEDAVCRFCFETLVAAEGDSEDYLLSNFSIETLSQIIASMHY